MIGLILFEIFLSFRYDSSIWNISHSTIYLPLLISMFVFSFISIWSSRTVYKLRLAAFHRQMLNYQDFV